MSIYKSADGVDLEQTAQRTDIAHFMDVTGVDKQATAQEDEGVWARMGTGWTTMTESPSAQTKERKYINEKSSRKNITSYSPSFGFEDLLMFNDPTTRKVYDIYTKRKTGSDATVTIVTVDMFEEPVKETYYPARKGRYAVEVSSCDDDDDMIIKGNFNGQGDEAQGWFDPTNGKWSDTDPAAVV